MKRTYVDALQQHDTTCRHLSHHPTSHASWVCPNRIGDIDQLEEWNSGRESREELKNLKGSGRACGDSDGVADVNPLAASPIDASLTDYIVNVVYTPTNECFRRDCSKLILSRVSPPLEAMILHLAPHSPSGPLTLTFDDCELLLGFDTALCISHGLPLKTITPRMLLATLKIANYLLMSSKIYRWVAKHLPKARMQFDDALEMDAMEFRPGVKREEGEIKGYCEGVIRSRFNGWIQTEDIGKIRSFSVGYLKRILMIVQDHNDKFWVVMVWLSEDEEGRIKDLESLLDGIDLYMVDKHFMSDIVGHFAKNYDQVLGRWIKCLSNPRPSRIDPHGVYAFHLVLDIQSARKFDLMRKGYRYTVEVSNKQKLLNCKIAISSDFVLEDGFILPVHMKVNLIDNKGEKVNKNTKNILKNVSKDEGYEMSVDFEYDGYYENLKYIQIIVDVKHNLIQQSVLQ